MKIARHDILIILLIMSYGMAHEPEKASPTWTHYLRGGVVTTEASGGLLFYRIKRVQENTFYDLRLLAYLVGDETLGTVRYKSSRKFTRLPKLYKFTITSLRHSSESNLNIRYHYNQGLGVFIFEYPTTHLTTELALSYDISDYLNNTRKTSYIKGGLFWDVDIATSALALDFEYFYQISDIIPGENEQSRYEISSELNFPLTKNYLVTFGYEEEFYLSPNIQNVRSVYIAIGFKRLLSLIF